VTRACDLDGVSKHDATLKELDQRRSGKLWIGHEIGRETYFSRRSGVLRRNAGLIVSRVSEQQ
jgi:hypothetical protein